MSTPTIKSIAKGTKNKGFTFRITEALSNEIAEVKAKCEQHGLRVNMTESLTAALEREVKALQKHIQKIEPEWAPGQMNLPEIDNAKSSKKAHTKAQS